MPTQRIVRTAGSTAVPNAGAEPTGSFQTVPYLAPARPDPTGFGSSTVGVVFGYAHDRDGGLVYHDPSGGCRPKYCSRCDSPTRATHQSEEGSPVCTRHRKRPGAICPNCGDRYNGLAQYCSRACMHEDC